ncbi:MAG: VCBS repeat-containing protein [Planctomycetales bacterium]|nr:VCBS repeat-containing protein [Planctomycetales bacterium]MCA9166059.1 VCBS repeat-containing protein [Planctomycetales bacterium]
MRRTFILLFASSCLLSGLVFQTRAVAELSAPVAYAYGVAPDTYVPNAAPAAEVAADFNRDGMLDIVVTHRRDASVYLFPGNGDGTLQSAVQISVGVPIQGNVYVADFNGDALLDLFLPSADGRAIVVTGKGDGAFNQAIISSSFNLAGYYPRGWAVGKFFNRSTLDIAFTLPTNAGKPARYGVIPGNGDGTFGDAIVGPGDLVYSRWIAPADFNRDGKLDLAVADGHGTSANTGTARLVMLLGNGDGTFKVGEHYASPQFPSGNGWHDVNAVGHPENVAVADLANRGVLDVIVSDYSSTINVFRGNGDGTFEAAVSYNPGNYPRNVLPVDINGDTRLDLVVTNVGIGIGGAIFERVGAQAGSVSVLFGNGDGSFQQPITYNPSAFPGYTLAADLNRDGHPDLVTTQVFDGHAIHVMLNRTAGSNLPPTFVNPPSIVAAGDHAHFSALADDDGGEAMLTYHWSTIGPTPAPVQFLVNDCSGARDTEAKIAATGTYVFQCKVTDGQGLSVIKLVGVTLP